MEDNEKPVTKKEVMEMIDKFAGDFLLTNRHIGEKREEEGRELIEKVITAQEERARRFKKFFYLLMRDELTIGKVNKLAGDVLREEGESRFSDEILAIKAESLVRMFADGQYLVTEVDAQYQIHEVDENV